MERRKSTAIWISWYNHRRTDGLCDAWNIPKLILDTRLKGMARSVLLSFKTVSVLQKKTPRILIVPNPSLGLAILGILLRGIFRYRLIVDAHNEGIRPYVRSSRLVHRLTQAILKNADRTIVSNDYLATDVREADGFPLVLPDRLPDIEGSKETIDFAGRKSSSVLVISTFAPDEPLSEIIMAARDMPSVLFEVTGRPNTTAIPEQDLPKNVKYTGFLAEGEYWTKLKESDVICDLTMMPDCLVCGAYEGLALGKAMILSDNRATRDLFGECAVLTGSSAAEIRYAISKALSEKDEFQSAARRVRLEYSEAWSARAEDVWRSINMGTGAAPDQKHNLGADDLRQ